MSEKREDETCSCRSYYTIQSKRAIITYRVRLALLFTCKRFLNLILKLIILKIFVFIIGLHVLLFRGCVYLPEWTQRWCKLFSNDSYMYFSTNRVCPFENNPFFPFIFFFFDNIYVYKSTYTYIFMIKFKF